MRVLIIKTSSMGDIIHTLPALTDAAQVQPDIRFDWVVEERFAEIPSWHANVEKIIPVAVRRWRKNLWRAYRSGEWQAFYQSLRQENYDLVIDAQGLIKSALLTRLSKGLRYGLDRHSAWESLASFAYQKKVSINPHQHAVTRVRQLFSQCLNYTLANAEANYGIERSRLPVWQTNGNYLVFLPNTTWTSKQWPEAYWHTLVQHATNAGWQVLIAWGNKAEQEQAERLAALSTLAQALPYLSVAEMAGVLAGASAVVGVDTGFAHLAAALNIPTISLYGATDAQLTGTLGANQYHLSANFPCAPCLNPQCQYREPSPCQPACFQTISPEKVWEELRRII